MFPPKTKAIEEYLLRYSQLSESELKNITDAFSFRRFRKDELFAEAGQSQTHIGFNLNGLFRYFYLDLEGRDITKHFLVNNRFILSLSSLIDHSEMLFSIEALEDSEILVAPIDCVHQLIKSSPYCRSMYEHILENTYVEKEKREAAFLLNNATERYRNFLKEFPGECQRIKKYHVASYLGITPESLSRIRNQLEKS